MDKPQYKILLVEDDPGMTSLIMESFGSAGYLLIAACDIKEGREKLKQNRPDLVILDRGLPDGDGLELCAEIRKDPKYQSLPMLMLTGKAETTDKVLGLRLGADDYLAKPFAISELKARVEAIFRRTEELGLRRDIKKSLWKY